MRQIGHIEQGRISGKGSDIRFIVTNLSGKAKVLHEKVRCARGRMENRPLNRATFAAA